MNTREKFSYMAFGAALMFLGMLLTLMSPLTAQQDKFGEIECTKLTVVDDKGQKVAELGANEYGGRVSVYGNDGESAKAAIVVGKHGGHVGVYGKEGKPGVSVEVAEHGGVVGVLGNDGKSMASLNIDEHGGAIGVLGNDGIFGASLGINEHGGVVGVAGKDRKSGALLRVSEHGGHVEVRGKGKGAAIMGINEYGDVAVSTWDRNGNPLK